MSPTLANVYLHYVLDLWFTVKVKRESRGEAYLIRYTDDFLCFFQYQEDAETFNQKLIERLRKFNLEIAEGKTKALNLDALRKKGVHGEEKVNRELLIFSDIRITVTRVKMEDSASRGQPVGRNSERS
ncbi:MAG: reverse transcriptase domain-containing protein [Veillonellales bacterium]